MKTLVLILCLFFATGPLLEAAELEPLRVQFGAQSINVAKVRPLAEQSFHINIGQIFVDFAWKENLQVVEKKYLLSGRLSGTGGDATFWGIDYHGEASGAEASFGLAMEIPGVPVAENLSVNVQVFAADEDELPLLTGTMTIDTLHPGNQEAGTIILRYTNLVDGDKDGYANSAIGGTDCNDADAAVHPDATEVCDGNDTACNGYEDEIQLCFDSASKEVYRLLSSVYTTKSS